MTKVKEVLEELMKQSSQPANSFKNLSLLLKWFGMETEDKNIQYSQYSCHELNIFLYFKDKEYFEKIVRPHLVNKMEKTFVDLYLLGDYEKIFKYAEIKRKDLS